MIVSQFCINGNAKQAQLVRVFGIQPLALKRWVKKYRADGPKAFFETRRSNVLRQKKSLNIALTTQSQAPLPTDSDPGHISALEDHIVREKLNVHHQDEARALIRDLCTTPADLIPGPEAKTLTVSLHSLATPKNNAAIAHLCIELNASETTYPGTDLRMIFKTVSS